MCAPPCTSSAHKDWLLQDGVCAAMVPASRAQIDDEDALGTVRCSRAPSGARGHKGDEWCRFLLGESFDERPMQFDKRNAYSQRQWENILCRLKLEAEYRKLRPPGSKPAPQRGARGKPGKQAAAHRRRESVTVLG